MRLYPFFIPHAGCPHRCLYCRQEVTSGGEEAPAPMEVARFLERCTAARPGGEAAFYGGSFSLLPRRRQQDYLKAAAQLVRAGRLAGIRISTRPDGLEAAAVTFLRQAGVTTVEIGCQSFSSRVLERSGRGHAPEAAAGAVFRLRRAGLRVGLQLMPGLPGGDRREALGSLEEALALQPDFLRIYPTVVLAGSALETAWQKGDYRPLALEEAVDWCAAMLWRCRRAGVPVIRLGLQNTAQLDRFGAVVAGPYHPAFGQLVRSRLWRRALRRGRELTGSGRVGVHPSDLGDARGHRRANLELPGGASAGFLIEGDSDVPREGLRIGGRIYSLNQLAGYRESWQ